MALRAIVAIGHSQNIIVTPLLPWPYPHYLMALSFVLALCDLDMHLIQREISRYLVTMALLAEWYRALRGQKLVYQLTQDLGITKWANLLSSVQLWHIHAVK